MDVEALCGFDAEKLFLRSIVRCVVCITAISDLSDRAAVSG